MQTLIGTAEVIIEANGQIPHDEYMQLRNAVCRNCYDVATSTRKLVLFSLYGDSYPIPKNYEIGLNEMIRTVLNSYDQHFKTQSKNIEFVTDVADDVKITTNMLLQELINCLLDNVVKYATGDTILLRSTQTDSTYSIEVSNIGPAIPTAEAERIFVPFVRLSPDEHALGIGLPLAKCLATSMGYTLTLDTTYKEGTRYNINGL